MFFMLTSSEGVNIRVPNIYKLTPELLAMVSSAPQDDTDSLTDRGTLAGGPLQGQANANANLDLFTASTPRTDTSIPQW